MSYLPNSSIRACEYLLMANAPRPWNEGGWGFGVAVLAGSRHLSSRPGHCDLNTPFVLLVLVLRSVSFTL